MHAVWRIAGATLSPGRWFCRGVTGMLLHTFCLDNSQQRCHQIAPMALYFRNLYVSISTIGWNVIGRWRDWTVSRLKREADRVL